MTQEREDERGTADSGGSGKPTAVDAVRGHGPTPADIPPGAPGPSDASDIVEPAGHFRVYLGAAAGVGKTYAMLNEGRRRVQRGADVVIGFVEAHGRRLTQDQAVGLEAVPRRRVDYRGTELDEMDVDAVIRRKPQIALVDELAHTNVPGSGRNEKRWQDVKEILAAGIDVITTVNIQHLESIADAVEEMTGVKVRERVPDRIVREANQIELVDSSPEQLRRRMLHGNIYPQDKVAQALTHFFRTDNLTALRELALRFVADETEEELLEHLDRSRTDTVWETTERIMVGVTGAPGTDILLRRACRLAARVKADVDVVFVAPVDAESPGAAHAIADLRRLADDMAARWHDLPAGKPGAALIAFAREHHVTQLVIGSSRRSRWRELTGGGSVVRRIIRDAGEAGIDVHVIARREVPRELTDQALSQDAPGAGG